jgi:hypothetical protein
MSLVSHAIIANMSDLCKNAIASNVFKTAMSYPRKSILIYSYYAYSNLFFKHP